MNPPTTSPTQDLLSHTLAFCDDCLTRQDYAAAWQALCRAVTLAPQSPDILSHRGRLALFLKDSETAQRDFSAALKIAPRCSAALSGLARYHLEQGDSADAEAAANSALAIDPADEEAAQVKADLRVERIKTPPCGFRSSDPQETLHNGITRAALTTGECARSKVLSVITPADSPDITPDDYQKALSIVEAVCSPSEPTSPEQPTIPQTPIQHFGCAWHTPFNRPVYGTVIPKEALLRPSFDYVNRLRLNCNHFTGYDLRNVFSTSSTPSWTDGLARPDDQAIPGAPDWSIGAFFSIAQELPESLIFQPPVKLGESGWKVDGYLINRDIVAYQERIALLHRSGILDKLRQRRQVRIIEIGCGYGALAYQLRQILPHACYFLCDLPLSLVTSLTYLALTRPADALMVCEESPADEVPVDYQGFVGLRNDLFGALDSMGFDLAINTLSFAEMPASVVDAYAKGLSQMLRPDGALFEQNFDNSHYAINSMCNPVQIIAKHFACGRYVDQHARWGPARLWTLNQES